jgi:hypothetical protein
MLVVGIVVGAMVFITAILCASIVGTAYDHQSVDVRLQNHPSLIVARELEHEEWFRNTIKSCLPVQNPKCKSFFPDADGEKKQRIAVLTPPGEASFSLYNKIEAIQYQHNHRIDKVGPFIDAFTRTSVPPYGYGKTHGLTKIVRLVPRPLVLEVTDALHSLLEPEETHKGITIHDLKAGLRMILRYHCRLSAVAAHTAMLSIDYKELEIDSAGVSRKLHSFLVPDDKLKDAGDEDDKMFEFVADDDPSGLFDAQMAYGVSAASVRRFVVVTSHRFEFLQTQMLTFIGASTKTNIHKLLDEVLVDELTKSKNLTIWPCPSFWSVGEEPLPLHISPLLQRLANELSPDCHNDSFAQRWVERDKCEAEGDGQCIGSKI